MAHSPSGREVFVEADQHFEFGEGFLAGVDAVQGVGHGAGSVGDDEGVLGVGFRVARVEVGCAAHRQPGQVDNGDAHRAGDGDRQSADRVRLVHDYQHPAVLDRLRNRSSSLAWSCGRGLSKTFFPAASSAQAWWACLPTSRPHQMSKPLS